MSALEEHFALMLKAHGVEKNFVREYRFCPERKFRFDFCDPLHRVACEIEGGVWVQGRHTRGAGYAKDAEKYNLATFLGWKVFHYTSRKDMEQFFPMYALLTKQEVSSGK
jgi:hypothetical protein